MSAVLVALGAVACAYGIVVAVPYPAGRFWLVWVALGALLVAVGWSMRSGTWAQLPALLRRGAGVAGALALAGALVGCGLIARAASTTAPAGLDYLVVLGATINPDGSPKDSLRFRLDAAAAYLDANPGTRCVVSGGRGDDEPQTEASAMKAYLTARGIDGARVLEEGRSTSTAENLRFSREVMAADGASADASVGVVTNDFHVLRSVLIARKAGLADACGVPAPTTALYLPQATLRECLALAKDALAGNL